MKRLIGNYWILPERGKLVERIDRTLLSQPSILIAVALEKISAGPTHNIERQYKVVKCSTEYNGILEQIINMLHYFVQKINARLRQIKRILMGDPDQILLSCSIVCQGQQQQLVPSDLSIFLPPDLSELFASGPVKCS